MPLPLRLLPRHSLISRSPAGFGLRYYTTPIPTNPRSRPPAHLAKPEANSAADADERLDGSSAFKPNPFNVPGSAIFGGSNLRDAALTTIVGLTMVFVGGVAYVRWYKYNVLRKIEDAFAAGYDPALELATYQNKNAGERKKEDDDDDNVIDNLDLPEDGPWTQHLRRKEQDWIDAIVHGEEPGHYFVLLGPKGSGKGTMIFEAMAATQADGVAMLDAHPDLEVFRLKLGKSINYEYNEDSQTGLFQRRDPREGGPALDIERALTKLEKVALKLARRREKPLVLIINNVHYFKNDDDGRGMLLQLQQRAESWAASGIVTCVFTTDDFWPFYVMRKTASRMHVLSIYDLNNHESIHAATRMFMNVNKTKKADQSIIQQAIDIVGGRLSYLNKVARSRDMLKMAKHLLAVEKAWLRSQIGLIPDCDDDVMDEQKWSSCSWLLLREFVKLRKEQEQAREEAIAAGTLQADETELPLPTIPYWRCREIMTRADFLEELDRANIIAIDVEHEVRPDSMLILQAAREVCDEEGFDELLDNVRDRIDEIESLHRTRELTFKDLQEGDRIYLSVDKGGPKIV
ncbi:hypothetical protein MIND_00029800 [Mycena indigotica]|uniref:AAA protein C-terminal winged helix domain-containing protein n=1 Tax=Mycena indigotica TaxID=2126181 RepID=A0A8H6TD76_9AGAR|nr:uncharacterized protein MIND_00029800 [Mycena indigotica]KAF7315154.1 hypothetical protein MIND_00029800 [Mycena indigotica]